MNILGIETSCDDTSVAVIEKKDKKCKILSSIVSSQIEVHAPYGGIVPNLAARAHLENIEPVYRKAMKEAGNPEINCIAVTVGPGLIPALMIGVNFAKALSYNLRKPIIGINHLEGHLHANLINNPEIEFPALGLIVSGGHTQLILMNNFGEYQLIGETRDDAAGEAFDKVAKLLGLGYPGGPIISKKAEKGDINAFDLPRPMMHLNNFDFSFSGLKTAVLYLTKKENKFSEEYINNMAASFEQAAVDVLIYKTIKAAQKFKVKTLMISGGVAANKKLRKEIQEKAEKELKVDLRIPKIEFCTDNAVMIAMVPCFKKEQAQLNNWTKVQANANLKLTD